MRKRRINIFVSLLLIVFFNFAFLSNTSAAEIGREYYTQYNIWVEREKHKTTNYSRGELIPFNTAVVLESFDDDEMTLSLDGRLIEIDNVRKHTQRDIKEIADELLGTSKVSLGGVGNDIRGDMESGNLRLGMTKEQVLLTRGYPPRHKTASTKSNTWIYWSSRFVHLTLVFRDNKLVEGRGLH